MAGGTNLHVSEILLIVVLAIRRGLLSARCYGAICCVAAVAGAVLASAAAYIRWRGSGACGPSRTQLPFALDLMRIVARGGPFAAARLAGAGQGI